jgi:hypothetical protein
LPLAEEASSGARWGDVGVVGSVGLLSFLGSGLGDILYGAVAMYNSPPISSAVWGFRGEICSRMEVEWR